MKSLNISGFRFGKLVVLSQVGITKNGTLVWACVCDCGMRCTSNVSQLNRGRKQSCGCLHKEKTVTHGMSYSNEYRIWALMIQRCINPLNKNYKNYGGRGIDVCQKWIESFESFYKDMGERPSSHHTLDRINNDIGYSPENCRWATRLEQANNRSSCVNLEHDGAIRTIAQWSAITGIPRTAIYQRIAAGWSVSRAILTPVAPRARNLQET